MANTMESDNTKKAKDDITDIKNDIKKLMGKLGNLTDDSVGILANELDNFSASIKDIRDKSTKLGHDCLAGIYNSTRQHPVRNLGYAFISGIIISLILRK